MMVSHNGGHRRAFHGRGHCGWCVGESISRRHYLYHGRRLLAAEKGPTTHLVPVVQGSSPFATVELRQAKKGSSGGFGSFGWMGPRNGAVKFGVLHCGALEYRDRSPPMGI